MKTLMKSLIFALLGVAAFAQPLPQYGSALTKTTLSAAITSSQQTVAVAATTGCPASGTFNPVSNPCVLAVGHEIMSVVAINGTNLTVDRGAFGTRAEANPSGSLAFIGSNSALPPLTKLDNNYPFTGFTFFSTPWTTVAAGSITDVDGKLWYSAIEVPQATVITKACILKGGGTMTDSVILAIWDRNGNLLANTTTAGVALTGTASLYQCIALSNAVLLNGPQVYYVGVEGHGTTAGQFGMYAAGSMPDLYPTGSQTGGTWPAVGNITAPATTFTAAVGPIMYLE